MSLVSEQAGFDALNALVVDPLLEQLNDSLSEFNLFEALGAVRQELRHSNFLAWLLNPSENHGLGDYALRKFVMLVAREINDPSANISPSWPLENAEIRREWRNIDILIADPEKKYVVAIENKIYSGEHSGQLERYQASVKHEFFHATQLFIFLTPDGTLPESETSIYIPIAYKDIYVLISDVLKAKHNTLSIDIQVFIQHYITMLERHILPDSEIARLCREIYAQNKQAIDLILEHRPDIQEQIYDELKALVSQITSEFTLAGSSKSSVRFEVNDWQVKYLLKSEWNNTNNVLWFEFGNAPTRLNLKLYIGPGPTELRQYIFSSISAKALPPFKSSYKNLYPKFQTIYTKDILRQPDYEGNSIDELRTKIYKEWEEFYQEDFPRINEVIMREVVHGYRGVE